MIWTREQAKAVIDRVLSMSKAEETFVTVNGADRGNLRFARNTATTSGGSTGHSLAVTASFGKKSGSVTTASSTMPACGRPWRTLKRSPASRRTIRKRCQCSVRRSTARARRISKTSPR